jgi:hypothetical protein
MADCKQIVALLNLPLQRFVSQSGYQVLEQAILLQTIKHLQRSLNDLQQTFDDP